MRFAAVMAAALALAGCVGPAPSQEAPAGQIDGALVDGLLHPHAFADVRLVELDRVDTTNELGGFTFRDVPAGHYTLQAQVDGSHASQAVTVWAGRTTPIIVQIVAPLPSVPHVAALSHGGGVDLGVPGTDCGPCAWRTALEGRPDHVALDATWGDGPLQGSPTRLVVELRDPDGGLLARAAGDSPLHARVDGSALLGVDAVEVRVRFHPDNEVPHPAFEMRSDLCIYYGVSPDDGFGCNRT